MSRVKHAEHFFSKAFSVGLEAGLIGEVRISEREALGDSDQETTTDHYRFAPKGSIMFRIYF